MREPSKPRVDHANYQKDFQSSQSQIHIGYFGGLTVEVPRRRFGVPAVIGGREDGGGDDVGGNEDVAAKDEVVGHRLVVDVRAENGIDDLVVKAHLESVTESKASLDVPSSMCLMPCSQSSCMFHSTY